MSKLSKDQVLESLNIACDKLGVSNPIKGNIDVMTQTEAFEYDADGPEFMFTDGRPVSFYLFYSDHPDYCFIMDDFDISQAQQSMEQWIKELKLDQRVEFK